MEGILLGQSLSSALIRSTVVKHLVTIFEIDKA